MENLYIHAQILESQRRFQRACDQIVLLNAKMETLNWKYEQAVGASQKNFRYTVRMRMLVLEGILQIFCRYASLKKNETMNLRFKLDRDSSDTDVVDTSSESESDFEDM